MEQKELLTLPIIRREEEHIATGKILTETFISSVDTILVMIGMISGNMTGIPTCSHGSQVPHLRVASELMVLREFLISITFLLHAMRIVPSGKMPAVNFGCGVEYKRAAMDGCSMISGTTNRLHKNGRGWVGRTMATP